MKRKQLLMFLLAGGILLMAGCGRNEGAAQNAAGASVSVAKEGFPIVSEPITLTALARVAPVHGSWKEMLLFNEYEKMTGIHVDFEEIPQQGFAERLGLILASNDLPDMFVRDNLTSADVAKYGPSGALMDMGSFIDGGYAPAITEHFTEMPEIRSACTSLDGHIYALPAVVTLNSARTDKYWVNVEWLTQWEKVTGNNGIETSGDLYDYLKYIKSHDMNGDGDREDEVGLTLNTSDNIMSLYTKLGGMFGLQEQMRTTLNIEDGKVLFWPRGEKAKRATEYFARLYQEGLLDPQLFSMTNELFLSRINPDTIGFFVNQADDVFSSYRDSFVGNGAIEGPDGFRFINNRPVARDFGTFAISSKNKYPEASLRWVDYFYSREGSLFLRMGIEGDTYLKDGEGKYVYSEKIRNDERGQGVAIGQMTIWVYGGAPHWINEENSIAINSPRTQAAQDAFGSDLLTPVYEAPILDAKTQQTVNTLSFDINTYVQESLSKFICGDIGFDKWDEYVATLEKLKVGQLEAIYQDAYDKVK